MRLFIAIAFPNKIKDRLKAGMDDLRRQGVRASWSRRENLHLTLEFLGELDSAKEAIAAMEQVQAAPFRLEFAPSGRFRRREGDIFWLGIQPNLVPIVLTSPWLVTCEIRVKSCFRSHFRRRCWCQNLF